MVKSPVCSTILPLIKMRGISIHNFHKGGARGVMVIVAGNVHGDTSSNPGRDLLHFT